MALTIPRTPLVDEPLDVWRENRGTNLGELGRQALAQVLTEAGVELGAYDERIVRWLGEFELSVAVTVASWLARAYDAGREVGLSNGLACAAEVLGHHSAADSLSPATEPATPPGG